MAKLKGTVVGWEKVTVPAGSFDAIKVTVEGVFRGSNATASWSGTQSSTLWYVPEVKNIAKLIYQDWSGGRMFTHDILELVTFKPAQ